MSGRTVRTILLAMAGATLALGGCQTTKRAPPPAPEPTPVPAPPPVVPVLILPKPAPPPPPPPKSCVPPALGAAPRYPDTDTALRNAPGAADRYQLLAAGRILRQERLEDLERVIAGCR